MNKINDLKTIKFVREIAFGDCDPAGIAYTGRIIGYALEAIDDFWKTILDGKGWYQFNVDYNLGTPLVNININFQNPITPREKLHLSVGVLKRGKTSIEFQVKAYQDSNLCFTGSFMSVFVSKDTVQKTHPPSWITIPLDAFMIDIES